MTTFTNENTKNGPDHSQKSSEKKQKDNPRFLSHTRSIPKPSQFGLNIAEVSSELHPAVPDISCPEKKKNKHQLKTIPKAELAIIRHYLYFFKFCQSCI